MSGVNYTSCSHQAQLIIDVSDGSRLLDVEWWTNFGRPRPVLTVARGRALAAGYLSQVIVSSKTGARAHDCVGDVLAYRPDRIGE